MKHEHIFHRLHQLTSITLPTANRQLNHVFYCHKKKNLWTFIQSTCLVWMVQVQSWSNSVRFDCLCSISCQFPKFANQCASCAHEMKTKWLYQRKSQKHFGEPNHIHSKYQKNLFIHSFTFHMAIDIRSCSIWKDAESKFHLIQSCEIQQVRIQFTNLILIPNQKQSKPFVNGVRLLVRRFSSFFFFVLFVSILLYEFVHFQMIFIHSLKCKKFDSFLLDEERYVFIRFTLASIHSTLYLSSFYRLHLHAVGLKPKVSRSISSHESVALHSIRSFRSLLVIGCSPFLPVLTSTGIYMGDNKAAV